MHTILNILTLSIITLSVMTLCLRITNKTQNIRCWVLLFWVFYKLRGTTTLSITSFIELTFSITTFTIMAFIKMKFSITQKCDNQHYSIALLFWVPFILSVIMVNVILPRVVAPWWYLFMFHYSWECHYAECRFAECHYAECHVKNVMIREYTMLIGVACLTCFGLVATT